MIVLPFPPRDPSARASARAVVGARGSFTAPSGLTGRFIGSYRLERLRGEFGQLVAVGVLTGQLFDADESHIAVGSRRHTAAADLTSSEAEHVVRLGPVDVNLAGFMVDVQEILVVIRRAAAPV